MAKYDKYLVDKCRDLINKKMTQAKRDFDKCARRTNNKMYTEVVNMYDTLITQFYRYKTTSYIRHYEFTTGTGEGQNLYLGKNFAKDNHNRHSPRLIVEFSGSQMYDTPPYQYASTDQVLNYVMSGIRFALPNQSQGMMTINPFEMTYHGKYFRYNGGTIKHAFELFDKQWIDLSSDVFYSMWDEYVRYWK